MPQPQEKIIPKPEIILKKVRINNLKEINLTLKTGELIVFTGLSGSGKSSLAFETIYQEGRRRYLESLPHSSRQLFAERQKPAAEEISGLTPTIAIEQKTISHNPRSTVGTMTGIYDFLRVLFAKTAKAYCPISEERVRPQTKEELAELIQKEFYQQKIVVIAPFVKNKKGSFKEELKALLKKGFLHLRLDGRIVNLTDNPKLDEKQEHTLEIITDRFTVGEDKKRILESLSSALEIGSGLFSILEIQSQKEKIFSEKAYSSKSGQFYPTLEPINFSFNHPLGMCPKCQGLGEIFEFDLKKILQPKLSIAQDCCLIAPHFQTLRYSNIYGNLARLFHFDVKTPWEDLSEEAKNVFLYGTKEKWTKMLFHHPEKNQRWVEYVQFKGVISEAHQRLKEAKSPLYLKKMHSLMTQMVCPDCQGHRLAPYPLASRFHNKKIFEITALTIEEMLAFFKQISLDDTEAPIAAPLILEISKRLQYLIDVGLGYLSLDRTAPSLSGGEAQRVRLSAALGSGLIGTTYILDEPSIGLHPTDQSRLIATLKQLKALGNTVIVVEHDRETILAADHIVDIGPLAGAMGGEIVAQGKIPDLIACPRSLTGQYLSGQKTIFSLFPKRRPKQFLEIRGANHNNLKNLSSASGSAI
ncbi:MAG: excinuclease ABC subunit A, partial [Parachlamydiales bacterium]